MSNGLLETRFAPLTQLVRHRLLSQPGEVLVRVGDWVQADDVVAQATVEGELHAIDLARALGVGVHSLRRHVRVEEGQHVEKGTALASARGPYLRVRQVKSPFAGTVRVITEGRLFIRAESRLLQQHAYIPGEIVEQYPHRGVAIRTLGALVRGIWGRGDERQGPIVSMVNSPGEVLTWERVGLRYRGAILVGGILEDARVLFRARQFRLNGIVVGSILPKLRSTCEELSLPIVVTEGMGRIPMAEPIFDLLRSHRGRSAVISGSDGNGGSGPEVIVPLPAEADTQTTSLVVARAVEVGSRVRLTRPPYLGIVGEVTTLATTPQETAIGTRAVGAQVRLPDGRRVFVPYVNMESLD